MHVEKNPWLGPGKDVQIAWESTPVLWHVGHAIPIADVATRMRHAVLALTLAGWQRWSARAVSTRRTSPVQCDGSQDRQPSGLAHFSYDCAKFRRCFRLKSGTSMLPLWATSIGQITNARAGTMASGSWSATHIRLFGLQLNHTAGPGNGHHRTSPVCPWTTTS